MSRDYGIDIPTKEELIANVMRDENGNVSEQNIAKYVGVDSLKYIDIDTMKTVFGKTTCTSCFDGEYNKKILDW